MNAWRAYEQHIFTHFREIYPDANLTLGAKIHGRLSMTDRQIDLLIEDEVAGSLVTIVVECKYFSAKVDVKEVDSFIGFLHDIRASKGILITNYGFTKAAQQRAANDSRDVEIRILDFEDLESFVGFGGAIAHRDRHVVIFPCPSGWIIHPHPMADMLAVFSRPDETWQQALKSREVMYLGIASKDAFKSVTQFLEFQEQDARSRYTILTSTLLDVRPNRFANKFGRPTLLRKMIYQEYPELEFTVFVDFDDFFLYVVLTSPQTEVERNLKKLYFIARNAIPGFRPDFQKEFE